jgi:ABC-2 type transport system permease protein
VTTSLAEYRSHKELFSNLVLRELRSKYKRSFLGWTWSMINPLALTVVYTVVFEYFLKSNVGPGTPSNLNIFSLYLLTGLLPWNFFQSSVISCIGSLVGNGNLIKKTYFPRELLPAATVTSNIVSHLIEMGLLLTALLAFGNWRALIYLPFVIVLMALTVMMAIGVGLTVSVLNVYFRDIEYLMGILFMMWFFMTPVVYSISARPPHIQALLKINPMADAILSYHQVLYDGTRPGWFQFGYFAICAVVAFVVGRRVFARFEGRLAEEL